MADPLIVISRSQSRRGQTLSLGRVGGGGMRGYILFAGGLDVPGYLGSGSTFDLGEFGGHGGRRLRAGDTLHLALHPPAVVPGRRSVDQPKLGPDWTISVLYGPHGAPDFFAPEDIETILSAEWRVHYNSNRTGVPPDRPKAALGTRRWRRSGIASVEHPRQTLCDRRAGFHRRHAHHSRPPTDLRLAGSSARLS